MNEIEFGLDNLEHGWVDLRIATVDQEFAASVSQIPNDGLMEFLLAINAMLVGDSVISECRLSKQSGYYLVSLTNRAPDVEIAIRFVDDWRSIIARDKVVFQAECNTRRFVRTVHNAIEELRWTYGEDGYDRRWRRQFPRNEHAAIRRFLGFDR